MTKKWYIFSRFSKNFACGGLKIVIFLKNFRLRRAKNCEFSLKIFDIFLRFFEILVHWNIQQTTSFVDFSTKIFFYSPKKAKMQLFQWSRTDIKHPKSNKICWFFQLKKFVLKKVKISMFQCHCNDPKHLKKQWKMLISSVQRKYFVRSKKKQKWSRFNDHVLIWNIQKRNKICWFFQFNENIFSF